MTTHREHVSADRYVYDFGLCSTKRGFAQVDTGQDAWYFGTWANPFKLVIFCYTEGDCCTLVADTPDEFREELFKIKQWNQENGHGFGGIDPGFNEPLAERFRELGLGALLH